MRRQPLPRTVMPWLLLATSSQLTLATDPVDWAALTVSDDPPLQYKGDATFYGKGGDSQGACGYGASKANSMGLPWSSGTSLTVAVNDFQYADGLSCGMCVKFRGVGTGIGTEPLPQQWQYAVVTNRCPECAPGSLDLAASGNGRWQMQWVPIPCDVGQSSFFYHVVSPSSNPYYFAFSVSNTRVPLKNVELESDGSWASLRRDVSNSWNASGGTYKCPLHIRLTSVVGDVVEDWVPSNQGGQGTAQFAEAPADPTGATAGALPLTSDDPGITSGDAAPVAVHWNAPNGTWVTTNSSNPATPGAPTRGPSSNSASAAGSSSTSASSTAATVTAGASSSSPPPSSPPPSQPSSSSSSSLASSSASGQTGIANWQQCGGTYRCSSNCADAAYSDKLCSSGLSCMRYDSTWWQCRPKQQGFTSATPTPPQGEMNLYDSDSSDSSSTSSSGSSSASVSAGGGGSLAFGGNIGSSGASASSAGASATAGRKMLVSHIRQARS